MTMMAVFIVLAVVWSGRVEASLTGGVLHHSYYMRLQEMPLPGTEGAVFHGDVYTTAYRRGRELGCVSSGKFRPVFESWTVEGQCRFYECLPNNSSERIGTLIKRMHNCGPPGPDMVPFLCQYTNVPDPDTVAFPACCPRFQCRNNYDPRRLMLPEQSPVQGRLGNEVFNSAFSHPQQDRGGSGKRKITDAASTKPSQPLAAALKHSIEFIEFNFDHVSGAPSPVPKQTTRSRISASPERLSGATPRSTIRQRGSPRHRSRPVRMRKKFIRFMPPNSTESMKRLKTPTTKRRQPTAKQTTAFSIADILS